VNLGLLVAKNFSIFNAEGAEGAERVNIFHPHPSPPPSRGRE